MSAFDQFLYPRHCCAERPRKPDGSCCGSLPALPRPPPNSLQIPGMPAPPKTSPGQRQASGTGQGLGALPSLLSSPPVAHKRQVPSGERLLPAVVSSVGVTSKCSAPKTCVSPPPSTLDKGVSSPRGGCTRPQTPHSSPKGKASTGATGSRADVCP